jgi:hypothetical protein
MCGILLLSLETLFLPKFQQIHEEKKFIIIIKVEWNDKGNNKMEVNDCRKWGGQGGGESSRYVVQFLFSSWL